MSRLFRGAHILIFIIIVLFSTYILCLLLGVNKKLLHQFFERESAAKLVEFLVQAQNPSRANTTPPHYKFYSSLVEELISARVRYGAEVRSSLRDLRKALIVDMREEKKIKEAMSGGIFQYVFMCCFIWGFFYLAVNILETKNWDQGSGYIAAVQFIGFLLLLALIQFQKKLIFGPFNQYFRMVYNLKIMLQSSRPLNEIVKKVDLSQSEASSDFSVFFDRIQLLFRQMKVHGQLDTIEVDYLLSELWDHFEIQFLKFMKRLNALKMLSILVFVLPSFFICVALIFTQMKVFE